jgi:uncharacterized membrane protein YfcA
VVDHVFWDEPQVADGDIVIAIGVVAIAFLGSFLGSYVVARKQRRTIT